jgi:VWFA-related protein
MFFDARLGTFLLCTMVLPAVVPAQESTPATDPTPGMIWLDVVVTAKSGPPVSGLQQQDFTVLDDKVPVALNTFQALGGNQPPVEVVLLIDDVNTGFEHVAYERSEIDKFLRANGGHLAHPTTLVILTDAGLQVQDNFSTDGNALSAALDAQNIGLRTFRRGHALDDPPTRFQISFDALFQIVNHEGPRPGRKMILWVSPGWPLLSDPEDEQFVDIKQRQYIFDNAVRLSAMLRQGRITLYSIDPLGSEDFSGRAFRWQAFVNGLNKPGEADWGNLALQVIATQSGGLALTIGNDLAAELQQCIADAEAYYEISFAPSLDRRHGEYHRLQVRVAKGGATARTRQGYYVQP